MDYKRIYVLVSIALPFLHNIAAAAVVRLTQETPCLSAQTCRLRCSVLSANNDNGLLFVREPTTSVVTCPGGRDSCRPQFPALYSLTQVDSSTSYLDIRSFNASIDATIWSCADGFSGTPSSLQVVLNTLPTGPLTYGSTCVSGRVTSPASLSCSALSPGTPSATIAIVDSSNQTAASSQTGSVTGTVTRGGQASCSVTWSAFPSFPLNISPVLCDVQVAANVTISVRNIQGQDKVITCQAQGHPDTYTFQPWLQSWGEQEVRHVTRSQQGGQYNLTLTSYQDTGTYTCTVDNGVKDTRGQVIRSNASVTVTVEAAPVLLLPSDPAIVARDDGEPVRLSRSLYASPDLVNHTWFFNSTDVTSLIPGAKKNSSRDMILLPVHNITVTTEGTVVSLHLTVSQEHSGLYRLQACNRIGCSSTNVSLSFASAPSPPESLSANSTSYSVELSWTPGFAGGDFFQWFHVQYRRQDSQEGQWSDVSTADNRSSSDRTPVTVTVQGLQPDTSYVFRVRAQSSRPQRNLSNYTKVTMETLESSTAELVGAIVGGVVGAAALVVIIVVIVLLCIRRKNRGEDGKSLKKSPKESVAQGTSNPVYLGSPDEETSPSAHPILEDNLLYDSSHNSPTQSQSTSAAGDKRTKKTPNNDVYAVPMKKTKKTTEKGNTKSKTDKSTGGGLNSAQDAEKPGPVRELRGGLQYISVEVEQKPGQGARPVLSKKTKPSRPDDQHRNEPVDYAIIDHSKRA